MHIKVFMESKYYNKNVQNSQSQYFLQSKVDIMQ